jgi:hypothetical protein
MLFLSYSDQLRAGRMMNRGSNPRRGRKFISSLKTFRQALGSFQPHIEGVLEGTFPGVKEPGREQPYPLHSVEESFDGGARHFTINRPLCNRRIFCETKTITLRYKQYFLEQKRRSFRMSHKYAVSVLPYYVHEIRCLGGSGTCVLCIGRVLYKV